MGRRKVPLVAGCYYHVFNKSIAGYEIFRFEDEYLRMLETIRYYRTALPGQCYSDSLKNNNVRNPEIHGPERVCLLTYCIMPTHFHLLMGQIVENGIFDFMRLIQNSYAKNFNAKTKRKGPLWEGRFGARMITKDEDLLHMTRYIHLNPTSAGLVASPEAWKHSSYHEYIGDCGGAGLCDYKKLIPLSAEEYKKFINNRKDYQRSLQIIKSYLMD